MDRKLEAFITGFNSMTAGSRRQCHCGKNYYDSSGHWDFQEGELEAMQADKNSFNLGHSVGNLIFEGKDYVIDCGCWHDRARQIMKFLDSHQSSIADYFAAEKKRMQDLTDAIPVIDTK